MFNGKSYFLTVIEWVDWWKIVAAVVGTLAAIFTAWRGWMSLRADSLSVVRGELKLAKTDIARLFREAAVRIDNERQYLEEIDILQNKVAMMRENINELLRNGKSSS